MDEQELFIVLGTPSLKEVYKYTQFFLIIQAFT
jgi:hypothetical protein